MSELQVVPGEMTSASNQTISAAEGARGHGSPEEMTTAGSAIPGADSVDHLSELGTSWDEEVEAWADAVAAFGSQIAAAGDDFHGTDGGVGGLFGGLLPFGGS
jgi:uncharacterized protein YukE